jgi:hypothetical protein
MGAGRMGHAPYKDAGFKGCRSADDLLPLFTLSLGQARLERNVTVVRCCGKRCDEDHYGPATGLFVGLWGKQELNTEVPDEIGLVAAGGLEAASGHEKKDHRAMDFVTRAEVNRGLVLGRMECALVI